MVERTSRALDVRGAGGVRLVGEEHGPPEGRPVLLLHGGGQSRHAWKETAARLAAAGYRVVAMDARGHGDSEWSPEGAYAMDDFATDVTAAKATRWSPRPRWGPGSRAPPAGRTPAPCRP